MPHDSDPSVTWLASRSRAGFPVVGFGFIRSCSTYGLGDSGPDCVKLVVPRHLLDECSAPVVFENDEVADERQEPLGGEHPFQHHLELRDRRCSFFLVRDCAPGLEPLLPRGEGTDAGLEAVRNHENLIHREQCRQLSLVRLKLLPRGPDGRVLVSGILEFDDAERETVHKQHDVGSAFLLVLHDRQLVDREPVVVLRVFEVDDLRLGAPDLAVFGPVLDRDAFDEHLVESVVSHLETRSLRLSQLPESIFEGRSRE